MSRLFTEYATILIPGLAHWPPYEEANTQDFWSDWKIQSPLSTKLALVVSMLLIHAYCSLYKLSGKTAAQSLAQMENSPFFVIRQSYLMLKSLACLAYFSDPLVYQLAGADAGENNDSY